MTTPTELGPAGKLIAKGWTQGEMARDANGDAIEPNSKNAVCFCSAGALHAAYQKYDDYNKAYDKLLKIIGKESILTWNDDPSRTKEQVVEAMMKAGV